MCEDAFHSADSSAFGHFADNAQELLHMLSTKGTIPDDSIAIFSLAPENASLEVNSKVRCCFE